MRRTNSEHENESVVEGDPRQMIFEIRAVIQADQSQTLSRSRRDQPNKLDILTAHAPASLAFHAELSRWH